MLLARQGVRFSKGWDAGLVAEAGEIAASRLVAEVLPYARTEMEMHRNQGRKLVIATTSPDDLVRPLAEALGFDDIVATHYARTDGVFEGEVDGHYVWGKGKLAASQEWADSLTALIWPKATPIPTAGTTCRCSKQLDTLSR